jgi:hypothetical protein
MGREKRKIRTRQKQNSDATKEKFGREKEILGRDKRKVGTRQKKTLDVTKENLGPVQRKNLGRNTRKVRTGKRKFWTR